MARDVVTFVPFNTFFENKKTFFHNLLNEIPNQVVDYMKLKNITPN
jgi:hypothetical protein